MGRDDDERQRLLQELLRMQEAMETTAIPDLGPLLSIPLTMQQMKVVFILTSDPDGNTIQGVAKTMGVSLATMSGIVDRLEGQEMVRRVDDPSDHRVRRVLVTPKGRKIVQELLAARPQLSGQPLERLELDDLRALTQGVAALLRVMENPPPPAE